MATKQNLKGNTDKTYEIVNTFNKGYNTSVADDITSENVFRDMTNFLPSLEGNITKRPGINRLNVFNFFDKLLNYQDYEDLILSVKGNTNNNTVSSHLLNHVNYLYNVLFKLNKLEYTYISDGNNFNIEFEPETLSNLTIIEDNNDMLKDIKNFDLLLDFKEYDKFYKNKSYISLLFIFKGSYKEIKNNDISIETKAISVIKVSINLDKTDSNYLIDIKYEIRQPLRNNNKERIKFRYNGDDIIDLAIYANNYYFMNGYDALVKIDRKIDAKYNDLSIEEIYKDYNKIYKPTSIEVSNVGFNILSSTPLNFIDVQGTVDAIRGVFYTFEGEPTQTIPYNKEFKIHILASGTGDVPIPQYRPDNGEIDVAVNPYKDLNGYFNENKTIFTCTGLDTINKIELKLKKGSVEFLAYAPLGNVHNNEIGAINDISNLVLSSRYCKVINNQLVLYGNHGYMFFSEFDNFYYFPNYNNIYAADTENENIVGIAYFRQYYALFTNKRIKRMSGSFGSDNFGIYPLNDFIGCINPRSIRQIQNYIYFLSYNGIYILKQGYLGEGTENVEQLDLPIYNSYNSDSMLKGYTIQNYYALYSKNEAILYNFTNDAFYKLKTSDIDEEDTSILKVDETKYSIPFQYNRQQSKLYYGIKVKYKKEGFSDYEYLFDLCYQDFSEEETERTDNGLTFVSTVETTAMSLGTPTNYKKFKEVYVKLYNSYGKNIPLYVTIKVDDKIVVSPENYVIKYNNETETYYYIEEVKSNKTLKGYNVLGTLELGSDPVGERTMQILKIRVGSKGRSLKVTLSDGITQGQAGYSPNQNKYRFDLATLGIVYKLKKVKEG